MTDITYAPNSVASKALTQAIVVSAANGDNTLVAAPGAGKCLVVASLKGRRTSGSTASTVVTIKNGATAIDYDDFNDATPKNTFWDGSSVIQFRFLPENVALIANHSAANSITYTVRYLIHDV